MSGEGQQSRLLYELCALLLTILVSPGPSESSYLSSTPEEPVHLRRLRGAPASMRRMPAMTPAGFASLLLGASLALMLGGSVTFVIGFILMPWVAGLVVVLYLVGLVSGLSDLGRAILCPNSPSTSPKDCKEIKFYPDLHHNDYNVIPTGVPWCRKVGCNCDFWSDRMSWPN